jgi:hypothetical protein
MLKYEAQSITGYRFVIRMVLWLIYLGVVGGLVFWWINT